MQTCQSQTAVFSLIAVTATGEQLKKDIVATASGSSAEGDFYNQIACNHVSLEIGESAN
jgi:hypothetical protein